MSRDRQIEQDVKQAEAEAREAMKHAEVTRRAADRDVRKTVTSGQERIKLSISGQVNRMMSIVDDGDSTRAYFVDNDNSNSRIRLVGTAQATDDLTLGARIEVAVAPDESGKVNQENETTGDFFDQRWAEVSLDSKRYGKVSLGKGDTASNNSAEVDLSRTDVTQYASVGDLAGGMQFRDSNGNLTGIRVSDAFQDEDGLSRQSRLRYDTPTWRGFRLAASAVSDQRWDGSLWWSGSGNGVKAAGAIAVSSPQTSGTDKRYDASFSIMHERTGLNLTLSGGVLERDNGGDGTNRYTKVGWVQRFFSVGETALGIDYSHSENFPADNQDGDSFSIAAVQEFEKFGTELYAIVRRYSLDNDNDNGPNLQDITVGSLGARVKF